MGLSLYLLTLQRNIFDDRVFYVNTFHDEVIKPEAFNTIDHSYFQIALFFGFKKPLLILSPGLLLLDSFHFLDLQILKYTRACSLVSCQYYILDDFIYSLGLKYHMSAKFIVSTQTSFLNSRIIHPIVNSISWLG